MQAADVRKLIALSPRERAALMLDLGAELHRRLRTPHTARALPRQLVRESVTQTVAAPIIDSLHGVRAAAPQKTTGLKETGRTLNTKAGTIADFVLTPKRRKLLAQGAMDQTQDRSVDDLAVRQLGLGMMDSDPIARCCAAYAYWLATGADAAIPLLDNAIDSTDDDERLVGAHCLANIKPSRVKRLQGTEADDQPQTPPPQIPSIPYEGDPLQDLLDLRDEAWTELESAFPEATVKKSNKAISPDGGSLRRKIDVVPSNWFNTNLYAQELDGVFRGVQILDAPAKQRLCNTPFLHNAYIEIKDQDTASGLRKAARLMKSLKYDSDAIDLSSYDIVSLAYNIPVDWLNYPRGSVRNSQILPHLLSVSRT